MLNNVTQPFFWLYIVQTACADQRVQHHRMFATAVGTREEPVFPAYGHSPSGIFSDVVGDFHPAIVRIVRQCRPLVKCVRERLRQL